ncbi:MAG: hypothetical protein JWQ50_5646 [Caballeronia mineralivorans]|jgi:hypothetical protein|nr:hypothetical protein [Caballeronia mineralivorans]
MVARTLARGKVAIVAMLVYFAPSIVADRRGRRNVLLLALMNAAKRRSHRANPDPNEGARHGRCNRRPGAYASYPYGKGSSRDA